MSAHDAIIAARVKQTVQANRRRRPAPFAVGDQVYLSTMNLRLPKARARKRLDLSPELTMIDASLDVCYTNFLVSVTVPLNGRLIASCHILRRSRTLGSHGRILRGYGNWRSHGLSLERTARRRYANYARHRSCCARRLHP